MRQLHIDLIHLHKSTSYSVVYLIAGNKEKQTKIVTPLFKESVRKAFKRVVVGVEKYKLLNIEEL